MHKAERPRVLLHVGTSADGSTVGLPEVDMGQFYGVLGTRVGWAEDATLVGADTIVSGPAPLPVDDFSGGEAAVSPGPSPGRPMLVIPDSRGRVRCWQALKGLPYWGEQMAVVTEETPTEYLEHLEKAHVKVLVTRKVMTTGDDRGHVDLAQALRELKSKHGVTSVRVDSGGVLSGECFRLGLVDEVSLLVYPWIVGATDKTLCGAKLPAECAVRLKLVRTEVIAGPQELVLLDYSCSY